jgi:hypothetical protein
MEQRALLASALVLGCVTAAGAGGFYAVRGMAPSGAPEPVDQVSEASGTAVADPAEGTVAEVVMPEVAPTPAPTASSVAENTAPRPADVVVPAAPAPARSERATPVAPRRPAATPAAAPTRPVTPVQREEPVAAARDTPSSTPRPATTDTTPSATPRRDDTTTDTWPARDNAPAPDDRWATRDTSNGASSADTPLPSRSPVSETASPAAPVRRLETVTIPADAVVGIQLERGVSSTTARVEDPVRARVTRDLVSGGDVVIPAGAHLLGNVTLVEEGGRVKERARLGIRFHTLVLSNGTEIKLPTETIYRDGESPAGRSAAKIGGAAVGGAILGALMGGGKGAVIGAATGAGSGTGWAMAGDRQPAELRAGQSLTVRVSDTVSTQVER